MLYHLSMTSTNKKTGPIAVSTQSKETCPPDCAFRGSGCYAESGPLNIHWTLITKGERGVPFLEFCDQVKTIPRNSLWRYAQAGDLPGEGNKIDSDQLKSLVKANTGRKGFTYTHKPLTPENSKAIQEANEDGFTINLSSNNLNHADENVARDIAPVVVVIPENQIENSFTPKGNKVVVCPATFAKENGKRRALNRGELNGVTCASCGLCQKADRSVIVGFPTHGTGKAKAEKVVNNI